MYDTKLFEVGDKVEINPIYRSSVMSGLVKGKAGIIAEVETYLGLKYLVIYDKPYSYEGFTSTFDYYYHEELLRCEE
jgi:hypothetical protein